MSWQRKNIHNVEPDEFGPRTLNVWLVIREPEVSLCHCDVDVLFLFVIFF